MKVRTLIALLEAYKPDLDVIIQHDEEGGYWQPEFVEDKQIGEDDEFETVVNIGWME